MRAITELVTEGEFVPPPIARQIERPMDGPVHAVSRECFSLCVAFETSGFTGERAEERLRVRLSSAAEADHLERGEAAPVMALFRESRDAEGRLVGAPEAIHRGDLYSSDTRPLRAHGVHQDLKMKGRDS